MNKKCVIKNSETFFVCNTCHQYLESKQTILQKQLKVISYIKNIFAQKCPRCHKGKMFTHKWYQLKNMTAMAQKCPVCGQRTEIEPGFYYGTGYVSYALTVAISVATFIAWWVIVGISIYDNRVFYWLTLNAVLLLVLQPWVMRISRVVWLSWFYHKDDALYTISNTKI